MKIIYLDMDGVLADFNSEMIKTVGHTFEHYPDSKTAWAAYHAADPSGRIYARLRPMEDSWLLVQRVQEFAFHNDYAVEVLTAVPLFNRVPNAKQDKKSWLRQHFPSLEPVMNIGPYARHKKYHCRPGDILIDDKSINCVQWMEMNGEAILHRNAEDSIACLKTLKI